MSTVATAVQNSPAATADGGGDLQMAGTNDDSFQWDEQSQLYYHARFQFDSPNFHFICSSPSIQLLDCLA